MKRTKMFRSFLAFPAVLTLAICGCGGGGGGANAADSQASSGQVQVVSPPAGTVVTPGQSLSVTASPPNPGSVTSVSLVTTALGVSPIVTTPPYTMSLVVPNNIACSQSFAVIAHYADGSTATSASVPIDIEPDPSFVGALAADPKIVGIASVGGQTQIAVIAKLNDGSLTELKGCSKLSLSSEDQTIASVNGTGVISGLKAGTTNIVANYGSASIIVPVYVASLPSPAASASIRSTFKPQAFPPH